MAASDLLLKDQSTTSASFAPESTDQGTNAAGTTIKRTMFGSNDGAQVTLGAKADVAATAPGTAASWSAIALLKAIWVALGSPLQAGGAVSVSNLPATQATSIADGSAVTIGAKADAAWTGTGVGSVVAVLKSIWVALTGTVSTASVASSLASAGMTPTTSAGPAVVGKSSQGNFYRGMASNTSAVFGYLVVISANAIPSSGATITALEFQPLPARHSA